MADPAFVTLEDSARLAGHARWVETRLFAVLGAWVQAEPDPAAKIFWATRSRRHGNHASGWHQRQPRVAHLDIDALVVPAGTFASEAFDALGALGGTGHTAARLAAVGRVLLPSLVTAYRTWMERAHPLADTAVVAWARLVVDDEVAACGRARELLDGATGPASPAVGDEGLAALLGDDDILGLPAAWRA
ncbi:MAG: hypothetical protein ACR2HY_10290 [Acidimicrobiales bacterium]